MLRIVDRYLARELLFSFSAAVVVLLLVTVGATAADLLAKIARGRVAAELLFALLALRSVDALTLLVPLAAFLGVQIAYGRLYRDSEMAVLAASGLPVSGLLRPLLLFAIPLSITMGFVALWLAPASLREAQALQEQASRSLIVAGLEPGRFVDLPGNDGKIYVESMSPDGTDFGKLFVESERTDPHTKATRFNVITAAGGSLYHGAEGRRRFLRLDDGFRVEGELGQNDFRLMRYRHNDIELPDNSTDVTATSVKRSAPTTELIDSGDLTQRVELQWRLAAPVSVLVLALLGVPLARSSPREPRYARLLIALLAWIVYYNFLAICRAKLEAGAFDARIGFWCVQIPAALIAAYLIRRGQRLPRPRAARRALPAGTG